MHIDKDMHFMRNHIQKIIKLWYFDVVWVVKWRVSTSSWNLVFNMEIGIY